MTLRKSFTKKNDEKLLAIINQLGTSDWKKIAEKMPSFSARQCKDRYTIYLKDANRQEPWTVEEDNLLIKLQAEFGSHWTHISKFFNGRNINNIKNRWHRVIKFRVEESKLENTMSNNEKLAVAKFDELLDFEFQNIINKIDFNHNDIIEDIYFL